ncbi:MAG: hypothetical protein D6798_09715 [Deltaproteobacteria bacterium]|nr:MAG: hypothetical protein D6798_09715 [Deltaproteobacteria bacterium]
MKTPLRFLLADAPDLDDAMVLEVWRGDDMLADVRPGADGWAVTFFAHGQLVLSLDELDEIRRRAEEFVREETGVTS